MNGYVIKQMRDDDPDSDRGENEALRLPADMNDDGGLYMKIRRRFPSAVIVLILVVFASAGCQQSGLQNFLQPLSSSHAVTKKTQKAPAHLPVDERSIDELTARAKSLERQGQFNDAIASYLAVVRQRPARAEPYHRLAVLHDRIGDPSAAEQFYNTALEKKGNHAEVLCDYGYSQYLQGGYQAAESSLQKSLALDPKLARAHVNLGLVMARTGRDDEAVAHFKRAGCGDSTARANLAYAMAWDKKWDLAEQQFQLALAADPHSADARAGLAAIRGETSAPRNVQPVEIVRQVEEAKVVQVHFEDTSEVPPIYLE